MERTGDGKSAIVTGAGSGLGAATARALAGAGYRVAALDLDERGVAAGDGIEAYGCDVSDAGAVSATVAAILASFGRIDVAVNCAGVDHTYWVEEITVEQFDRIIAVNLRGPFLVAKALWPAMRAQGGGHIVNIASTAAVRAWSGASAYHASKFGLLGLGRGLSVEGRGDDIRVTTVIPGGMNTGFFERFKAQGIPMPDPEKLQSPDDVAQAILFAVTAPKGTVVQELIVTPDR
jgi:NAD(P)-dependent dehydrogenase (short-subunit alcohol dehydrogenase family)